jgi:hypothetical protein
MLYVLLLGGVALMASFEPAWAINSKLDNLERAASALFRGEQELRRIDEELSRVACTRSAPRVKRELQKKLSFQRDQVMSTLQKVRGVFGSEARVQVFDPNLPQHVGGSFRLESKNGLITCVSSTNGTSGSCVVESENATFQW